MIEEIKSKWDDIISFLKEEYEISEVSIKTWIQPLVPEKIIRNSEGNVLLYIIVPPNQPLFITHIDKRYSFLIKTSIEEITGIKCDIYFSTRDEINKSNTKKSIINNTKNPVNNSKLLNSNLNPRYTFDKFVVGKNNSFAHASSLAVAESPGEIYNPLFIYGGVGLGKTHLMQSIAHFILENNPDAKILYVTTENFTNELIDAIRHKNNYSTTEFRNKYRTNDVLIIDDIQFIVGRESTQEEFFHTFNALHQAKKQIIISSDRPPKDFVTLEDRITSRFEWGLTADINPPDYETRMAILRKKEDTEGFNIDNEVMQYIASNIKNNIRELEGALTKIVARGRLENKNINLELAKDCLRDIINPDTPVIITPELIKQVVSEHFSISVKDLESKGRSADIMIPRHIATYLCRILIKELPLKTIGKAFGGRDHTTVISSVKKIEDKIQVDSEIRNAVDILIKKISPH